MLIWTRPGLSGGLLLIALTLACTATPAVTPTSPAQPAAPAQAPATPVAASPAPATPPSPAPVAAPSPSPAAAAAVASPSTGARVRQLGSFTFQDHGTRDVKALNELDLEADDFYFSPTFLQGAPGQKLKLTVENEGQAQHNLSLGGQGIDTDIPPDGKAEVEVTFPASGALRFFCKYHADQGMNGELLAGDATPQPVSDGRGGY
jgi:plastocyanin